MKNWQEALEEASLDAVINESDHALIFAPNGVHPDYQVMTMPGLTTYSTATEQGCDRMLEELHISKDGWH